jgi:hypothetical protein
VALESSGLIQSSQNTNLLVPFVDEQSARSIFVRAISTTEALETMEGELSEERVVLFGGSRDVGVRSTVLAFAERSSGLFVFAPSYSVFDMTGEEVRRFWGRR